MSLCPVSDFPLLRQDPQLVYLDNAATTHKPQVVLDAMMQFYTQHNANVRRGVHALGHAATEAYERARASVARFIDAETSASVVFVRGATEGINLVASSFLPTCVPAGKRVVVTALEHHANWVPWQEQARRLGYRFSVLPVGADGTVSMATCQQWLEAGDVGLLAITHVSNVLGCVQPVAQWVELAHAYRVPVLVDGAQAVGHMPVSVRALDADFYVFSGHKLYAPMGIGVVYGKMEHWERMPPYQMGGGMIQSVGEHSTTFQGPPFRFEAGTPAVAEAVGLEAALHYLGQWGMDAVQAHDMMLSQRLDELLSQHPALQVLPATSSAVSVRSFVVQGVHAHDMGTVLDQLHLAVRVGDHCAMPLLRALGVPATVRISLGVYNSLADLQRLQTGLERAVSFWGV